MSCALCSNMKTEQLLLLEGTHRMKGVLRTSWTSLGCTTGPQSPLSLLLRISATSHGSMGSVVRLSSVDQPM